MNQHVSIIRTDGEQCDPGYLLSVLTHPSAKDYIASFNAGGSRRAITKGNIESFKIALPPLEDQKAIAGVLGALDDKIELNRRMNATLEAMARALFQSWFVDFDPVHAKQQGRQPAGMDDATAELFPNEFTPTPLGDLPSAWKCVQLFETCNGIFSGGTPSTKEPTYWNGTIPWLSSGETRNAFIIETEKFITPLGVDSSSTRSARSGSTVIASAGQGHTRGQTSMLGLNCYVNQSVVVLEADAAVSSDYFLFFNLARRYEEFRQLSDSHSSRGSLTTKLLGGIKIVQPPVEVIRRFDALVQPFVQQIIANAKQSRTLAALRDALLPKLLSGELKVGAVEASVSQQHQHHQ